MGNVDDRSLGLPVRPDWFRAEALGDGVTRLWEPFVDPFLESNVWHVAGRDRDLVVDAANGIGPLRPHIDRLRGDRPVVVVATHGHFDHIGGLHEFPDRRSHAADAAMPIPAPLRLLRSDFPEWLIEDFTYYECPVPSEVALTAVPEEGFDVAAWSTAASSPTTLVGEGDVIDLGDRAFEVLHTPGHTPGSICLWDGERAACFSGDAVYVDAPLGWTDRDAFAESLERLRALPAGIVHSGHGRSFDGDELREGSTRCSPASGAERAGRPPKTGAFVLPSSPGLGEHRGRTWRARTWRAGMTSQDDEEDAMRAVVYHGPGEKSWDEVADPKIEVDTDAIVKIDAVTICGTDLHILKGDVPEMTAGRILGHEAVGTVTELGAGVHSFDIGDHVLLSCISACGRCRFCKTGNFGQCLGGGGWIFGHLIDGVQAEYARVPFADNSLYKIPETLTDEQVLYLSDILPTGYEVGVLNGTVRPGDVVAVIGAGPVGLAAVMGAHLYSPAAVISIDPTPARRTWAEAFGADRAVDPADAKAAVDELTDGLGADVTIEAVGLPETFEQATELVRPGGHVANVGVHGKPAVLHLETLWTRDVTITTGLVDTFTIPTLLKAIQAGTIDPTRFTTHRFALSDAMDAYDTFSRAGETNALKVILSAS